MGTTRSLAAGHLPYRLLVDDFEPLFDLYAFEDEAHLSTPPHPVASWNHPSLRTREAQA